MKDIGEKKKNPLRTEESSDLQIPNNFKKTFSVTFQSEVI